MARKPRSLNDSSRSIPSQSPDSENTSSENDLTSAPEELQTRSDKAELRNASLQRAKSRPIRERIVAFFRGENKDYKELIINTEALERRVARIENGILQGFEVELWRRPNGGCYI